ncbi:Methyltransferase small domain-containing protein [Thermomonospora echinospora]|uniref:Methyltransferase small domain-containing protein n=1 Tax=Thermomonospora echinospora TaxID=1992 RepID=A0A1H6DEW5_9ACTN|nr:methyltransferase [Thermomonospora echinospora]SEG83602.1 Methyltransferase small domain-containing protein [Thermomonospora echinospora]
MNELGYAMAQEAYALVSQAPGQEGTFTLMDREWEQLDGVVGGQYNQATGLFAAWLPVDSARTFLEMGCGCGIAAVTAALRGCPAVTALDINPAAVRTTELNARRHGVRDRVRALESDLFGALGPDERFDMIFWNSPFIEAPPERVLGSFLEYHFFDPGYQMHRRFLAEAPDRLAEGGRLFLGFSEAMGDRVHLEKIADAAGLRCRTHRQETFPVPAAELGPDRLYQRYADGGGMVRIDFTLLELWRAADPGARDTEGRS